MSSYLVIFEKKLSVESGSSLTFCSNLEESKLKVPASFKLKPKSCIESITLVFTLLPFASSVVPSTT